MRMSKKNAVSCSRAASKSRRRPGRVPTGMRLKNQYFPEQQIVEMEGLSRKLGVTVSELMRRAVGEFLERERERGRGMERGK